MELLQYQKWYVAIDSQYLTITSFSTFCSIQCSVKCTMMIAGIQRNVTIVIWNKIEIETEIERCIYEFIIVV